MGPSDVVAEATLMKAVKTSTFAQTSQEEALSMVLCPRPDACLHRSGERLAVQVTVYWGYETCLRVWY